MLFLGPSGPMDTVSRNCSAEMGTKADFKKMGGGQGTQQCGFSRRAGSCLNFGFTFVLVFEFEERPRKRELCNYNCFLSCESKALKCSGRFDWKQTALSSGFQRSEFQFRFLSL